MVKEKDYSYTIEMDKLPEFNSTIIKTPKGIFRQKFYYQRMIICPRCNKLKPHNANGLCQSCAYMVRYWKDADKKREENKLRTRKWRAANPEKNLQIVRNRNAKKKGNKIENHRKVIRCRPWKRKAKECKECGSTQDLQLHHLDYKFPRKEITLCRTCHMKLHRKEIPIDILNLIQGVKE
jgi:hypothetical protein